MRRRVTAAIVGVAAGAVLLFAVPLAVTLRGVYADEELVLLQRDTVGATRGIDLGAAGASRDAIELPAGGDGLTVYDRAGRRVAGRGPLAPDAVTREALRSGRLSDSSADGRLVVSVPLLAGEQVTGVLRAERSDARVTDRAQRARMLIAAVAAGLILLAAMAAALLGRSLARPLERLSAAALRLGHGDFSARAPSSGVAEVDAVGGALTTTAVRLQAMLDRERAFSADASHQLRTPLAALRLELEATTLHHPATPEIAAALVEVDRLEATIQLLLDVARDAPRAPATCDLRAVVDDADRRWRSLLAAAGRPLRTDLQAVDATAGVAPGAVAEILDVLVDNALGHGRGVVRIVVRDAAGWLALEVADEGPGFADPEQALVRRAGSGDGHGIGLALAASLADAEGGRLVLSRPGPRPVVTVLLRRAG